VKPQFQIEKIN